MDLDNPKAPKAKAKDSMDTHPWEKVQDPKAQPDREEKGKDMPGHSMPAATTAGFMATAKTIAHLLEKDSKEGAMDADSLATLLPFAQKAKARGDQPTWQVRSHKG